MNAILKELRYIFVWRLPLLKLSNKDQKQMAESGTEQNVCVCPTQHFETTTVEQANNKMIIFILKHGGEQ